MKLKAFVSALMLSIAAAAQADTPSVHGMFIFGDKVTYASHLPMFHAPHDYQLVLKIAFAEVGGSQAVKSYEALKTHGQKVFTIEPELVDLTDVMNGKKTQFSAKLYEGHFERGGGSLGPVVVHVQKIVLSKKLTPSTQEQNKYFVFGELGEYFGVHLIQGKPSYDTVVKLRKPYLLEFSYCRTRVCADPTAVPVSDSQLPLLLPKVVLNGKTAPVIGDQVGIFNGVLTDVLDVLYFEQDELSH